MFLILQITLTILSALCVAAVVPVGVLVEWGWGAFCALLAVLFFVFMKICKTQVEIDKAKHPERYPDKQSSLPSATTEENGEKNGDGEREK